MTLTNHKIYINNFDNNETVCYSAVLLNGEITTKVNCKCNNNLSDEKKVYFKINSKEEIVTSLKNNQFKQIIALQFGLNEIRIGYCCVFTNFSLHFKPNVTDYYVVPVYILNKYHDGKFQAPDNTDNSVENACRKIAVGLRLIQCLIAEKFYELNLERRTFQLEQDLNPNVPECRILLSAYNVNEVRSMSQVELWSNFGRELIQSDFSGTKCKFVAFIACTRYKGDLYEEKSVVDHEDVIRLTEAHAALGGGGLAIFGSGCLHTWPSLLQDVVPYFQNDTRINRYKLMDDSCYRGTYGGCFATTLGAVCHELCHSFDLGHTSEGIMARGFDQINEEFTIQDIRTKLPPAQHYTIDFKPNGTTIETKKLLPKMKQTIHPVIVNRKKIIAKCNNHVYWTRSCSIILYNHKWLNMKLDSEIEHTLIFNKETLIAESTAGICVLELRNESTGLVLEWLEFNSQPVKKFNCGDLVNVDYSNSPVILVIEDVVGNILKEKL